jgi:hypothetical protein
MFPPSCRAWRTRLAQPANHRNRRPWTVSAASFPGSNHRMRLGLVPLAVIVLAAAGAVWVAGIHLSSSTDVLDTRLGLGEAIGGVRGRPQPREGRVNAGLRPSGKQPKARGKRNVKHRRREGTPTSAPCMLRLSQWLRLGVRSPSLPFARSPRSRRKQEVSANSGERARTVASTCHAEGRGFESHHPLWKSLQIGGCRRHTWKRWMQRGGTH